MVLCEKTRKRLFMFTLPLLLSLFCAAPAFSEVESRDSTTPDIEATEAVDTNKETETHSSASVHSGYRFITPDGPTVAASPYGKLTSGVVGVTLGERGSVFRIDGVVHRVPAPVVDAQDTNGAGDVFHGAYALALAEGMRVMDAIRFASAAAALKCRTGSGWEAVPDRAAVDEFLKGCTW